ncbi:dual specificity protein phosphatase 18-like isoform X1 [Dinothrombium tinctorium]|uniref:Dual specificity protein phosphatase 18-like isoform X1 n=1 Tax=Dinothrombium tinctorium TaxID=1965070 RepID=A0A443QUW8_9ACAR|nr:dual specificity protein phosphatase 18-like isoform X1 [Dinothrombium tinctorium]RWS06813.1 dual specificity protein phosphatase 18-like isoform X1 [Dinothrombium tinctorium]
MHTSYSEQTQPQSALQPSSSKVRKGPPDVLSLPSEKTLQTLKPNMPRDYQIIMAPIFTDFSQIDENLYLTGIGGMTRENIKNHRITCIVNTTYEAPNLRQPGIDSIRISVDDTPTDDIGQHFDIGVDKIAEHAKRGERSVVHCVAGVSRSAALVIAYLIKHKRMTLHDAFNHVRERRQVIRPNNGFFKQLIEYEKKHLGKASVKMITVEKEGVTIEIPDFFESEHPRTVQIEALKTKFKMQQQQGQKEQQSHTEDKKTNTQSDDELNL